jgi:hypothetical protein
LTARGRFAIVRAVVNKSSIFGVALVVAAAACGSGTRGGKGASDLRLPSDVRISEVAVYQGGKVTVAKEGAPVERGSVPLVAGRGALVRVYVAPEAGFMARELGCEVRVGDRVFSDSRLIVGATTEAELDTGFHVDVPGEALTADATISVTLRDATVLPQPPNTPSAARWPTDGTTAPLGLVATDAVRVVLVPVRYGGDGSGRLPDTSDAQMALYQRWMSDVYPASAITLTVREPIDYARPFTESSFDELNELLVSLRQDDGAPTDVYYYALVAPARSFAQYCGNGCVTGLSFLVSDVRDGAIRVGTGIGFAGADSAETMVHEVGHAHGRQHAPCDVTDPDPRYPYRNGATNVWGWSAGRAALVPPTASDFMGYCENVWVSDYTYAALYKRIAALAALVGSGGMAAPFGPASASVEAGARTRYRFVRLAADGSLRWGREVTLAGAPGEARPFAWIDATGATVRESTARFVPHGHGGGGVYLVPVDEAPRPARGLVLPGRAPLAL